CGWGGFRSGGRLGSAGRGSGFTSMVRFVFAIPIVTFLGEITSRPATLTSYVAGVSPTIRNEPSALVMTDIGGGKACGFGGRNCTTTGRVGAFCASVIVPVTTGPSASASSALVEPPFVVSIVVSGVRRTLPLCCTSAYTGILPAGTALIPNSSFRLIRVITVGPR